MKFHLVFYTTTPGLNRSIVTTSVWDPFAICLHWISSSLISTYIITLPSLLKLQWLENLMEMFGVWSTNFHLKLIFSIKTIAAAAKELYSYEDSLQTTGVNARYTDPFCIFLFLVMVYHQRCQKGIKLWDHQITTRIFSYPLQTSHKWRLFVYLPWIL